jgi:hypothetical protein
VDDSGPFSGWFGGKILLESAGVVFIGEDGYDASASPGAFTSGDVYSGTLNAAGWTPNEHEGKWVRITSGANDGMIRQVLSNTTDTLNFCACFNAAISTDTWEWVAPKSTLGGAIGFEAIAAPDSSVVGFKFDHMILEDSLEVYGIPAHFHNLYSTGVSLYHYGSGGNCQFELLGNGLNTTTGVSESAPGWSTAGAHCGVRADQISVRGAAVGNVYPLLANQLQMDRCHGLARIGGIRPAGVEWYRSRLTHCSERAGLLIRDSKFDGAGDIEYGVWEITIDCTDQSYGVTFDAIRLDRSKVDMLAVALDDFPRHGVHAVDSTLRVWGIISGVGDTGSGLGVMARWNSMVRILSTVTPTITGDGGEAGVQGAVDTWADIIAGAPLVDANEHATVNVDDLLTDGDWR